MSDHHYASLGSVCARLKSGEITAYALTEGLLERIRELDRDLHAYVMVLEDQALARASQLDEARAAGKPLGSLHGVPVAVKDLLFTRGLATASGTLVMQNFVPDQDAAVVERLTAAGAVIIGKTQLTEGAYGVHHPDVQAPRNPWDAERWPGVSSSGSGVAVAAGLCFGAIGSDTGGSIRFPAACCGIVGVKPTYGRVSRRGAFPLAESLDHFGPMTRRVADAARMLQAIAGRDPADPTSLDAPVPNYASVLDAPLTGCRVGVDWEYVTWGVEEPVSGTIRRAVELLESRGAKVVEVTMPPDYRELVAQWGVTCAVECARAHQAYYPARKDEYGEVLAELIEFGLRPPPGAYERLERLRGKFSAELDAVFADVQALLAPAMPYLPPPADGILALSQDPARASGLTFTAPFDFSGHPTLTLPAGLWENRLPLAVQLIGPRLGEPLLFRIGSALETELDFNAHPCP